MRLDALFILSLFYFSHGSPLSNLKVQLKKALSSQDRGPVEPPRPGRRKYVVAHHMVGNTYPYTQDTWASDIALAQANGIDGFALNVGTDSWQVTQVASA